MKVSSWPILGQSKAVHFFEKLLSYEQQQPGSLGGAYILSGPVGSGKTTLLEHFFAKLAEISETATNAYEISELRRLADKKEISVSQTRDFNRRLMLSSFGKGYRVGLVIGAEDLSIEAANALLKTLEEARSGLMIFLLTSDLDRLLKTVVSRSQIINLRSVPSELIYDWLIETHGVGRTQAKHLSRLSHGQPGRALELAQNVKQLEAHLQPLRFFCQAFSLSLAERWQVIGKLLSTAKGVESAERALEILTAWKLGARDLRLLILQQPNLVVHTLLLQELETVGKRLSLQDIYELEHSLTTAVSYLRANVNPKLVLEQAMMNLP